MTEETFSGEIQGNYVWQAWDGVVRQRDRAKFSIVVFNFSTENATFKQNFRKILYVPRKLVKNRERCENLQFSKGNLTSAKLRKFFTIFP